VLKPAVLRMPEEEKEAFSLYIFVLIIVLPKIKLM